MRGLSVGLCFESRITFGRNENVQMDRIFSNISWFGVKFEVKFGFRREECYPNGPGFSNAL